VGVGDVAYIYLLAASLNTTNLMIQTFSFTTKIADKEFHHTVHSFDLFKAVDKWTQQIEELQGAVYSFDANVVFQIRQQYSDGLIKINPENQFDFLTLKIDENIVVVYIRQIDKGEPDFIAKVSYLTTAQGGRKGYATSGYRPHIKFDGRSELTSGEQLYLDREKIFPGESTIAEIRIIAKELFKNYLFIGQHFEIAEASHLVGHGEIVEVVNPSLRQASR
jgi:hypothetical protein